MCHTKAPLATPCEQCSPVPAVSPGWLPFRAGLCQRDSSPWTGGEGAQRSQPHQRPTPQTHRQAWTADILSTASTAGWLSQFTASQKKAHRGIWTLSRHRQYGTICEWLFWSSGWCIMFYGRVGCDAGELMLWFESTCVCDVHQCGQLFGPWARAKLLCSLFVVRPIYELIVIH